MPVRKRDDVMEGAVGVFRWLNVQAVQVSTKGSRPISRCFSGELGINSGDDRTNRRERIWLVVDVEATSFEPTPPSLNWISR